MDFTDNPRIVPGKIEERKYQTAMAEGCLRESTLLILPTGLGKTIVALYVVATILRKGGKVLMLAPTKPLVEQHFRVFSDLLKDTEIGMMNGTAKPSVRAKIISSCDFIVSTPQSVANDLESEIYNLDDIDLLVYDEAHRGTGNYAYVTVAGHYPSEKLSLGMTASPGSDIRRIEEVCNNLMLTRIDLRSDDDPDVSPYIYSTYVNKIEVNMPKELTDIIDILKKMLDHYFMELTDLRLADPNWPASVKHMLAIGDTLQRRLARGEHTSVVFRGLAVQSICVKLLHAINLAETQGVSSLRAYMVRIDADAKSSKGAKGGKELVSRKEFKDAWQMVIGTNAEHPKISRIMSLVSRILDSGESGKVMVFSQYRDTCDLLVEKLSLIPSAKVGKLIGQSKGGLKQKEQMNVLEDFRSGKYNVIVSTSVGEEGLDISSTDAVIFYEPIPSEIRTIQRRGRTGRKNDGEVYVLIAKGTLDEVFDSSSMKKEELMRNRLEKLSSDLGRKKGSSCRGQMTIGNY